MTNDQVVQYILAAAAFAHGAADFVRAFGGAFQKSSNNA
jgi:hypothetical protein